MKDRSSISHHEFEGSDDGSFVEVLTHGETGGWLANTNALSSCTVLADNFVSDEGDDNAALDFDDVCDSDSSSSSTSDHDGPGSFPLKNGNVRRSNEVDDDLRFSSGVKEVNFAVPTNEATPPMVSIDQPPAVVWEETEPFALDESFDYDNCPRAPRPDLARLVEEYAARKAAGEVSSLGVFR